MKTQTDWKVSDVPTARYLGVLEIESKGEFHSFAVLATHDRLVFGGACNAGFLESGFIMRDDDEPDDALLSELLADLQSYYDDGASYVSRIVCNDRM